MSKAKLFIENFLVYGLGGIISKIIPFIMMSIVTWMMPGTAYFGLNDLILTITSFASAFAIMGMYDAMYRMFFEREDFLYKKTVCSTALSFVSCMAIVVFLFLVVFREDIASFFFEDTQFAYLVYFAAFATLTSAGNAIISAPTRMQNQRLLFLTINTVAPLLSYMVAIPLLLQGYYVIALPLAAVISGIVQNVSFFFLNRRWFSLCSFDLYLFKQLLTLAIPMMPSFLFYWIFNSCDRLMIAQFLGVGEVGIYAVGARMGQASYLIYLAFAGGWQYFAFSTMKEENQVESNSLIHEYLGAVSFLAGMWMCGVVRPLFGLLFPSEYSSGFIVASYLFLAPLLLMLFQVAGNQFLVIKKVIPGFLILFCGAFSNVTLNYFLIPRFGIEGAAISTLLGYVVSNILCMIVLCRMQLMVVSRRFLTTAGVTVLYYTIWRLWIYEVPLLSLGLAFIISVGFFLLYENEVKTIAERVKGYFDSKRK